MKPHPPNINRHPAPSRHSTWPKDGGATQPIPQQPQALTERLSRPPTKHTEKILSRRLHRKQAAGYIGTSLSWLDKSRLRGDGPAFLQVGGRVIYDVQDLDEFLASCRRQSTSEQR
jgi:hypothetical protein